MKRRELSNGIEEIIFDGFQSRPLFGYAFPGPGGKQGAMNAVVQHVIMAMQALDEATYAASRDAALSPSGRVQKVQPVRDAAKKAIENARLLHLQQEGQRISNARAKLFGAPELDPSDFAGAVTDMEIRQRFSALQGAAKDAAVNAIHKGDPAHDRIFHALLRDPFNTPDSQFARAVHARRVAAANPNTIAALEMDEASHEWAVSAVDGLSNVEKQTATSGIDALSPETVSYGT